MGDGRIACFLLIRRRQEVLDRLRLAVHNLLRQVIQDVLVGCEQRRQVFNLVCAAARRKHCEIHGSWQPCVSACDRSASPAGKSAVSALRRNTRVASRVKHRSAARGALRGQRRIFACDDHQAHRLREVVEQHIQRRMNLGLCDGMVVIEDQQQVLVEAGEFINERRVPVGQQSTGATLHNAYFMISYAL